MEAIAVVGLGCVLPNALRVSDFWASISAGKVSLSKVPAQAWNHAIHFHPDRSVADKTHCDLGGFITDFVFDWRKYKVPPSDAQQVNPLQWMILEAGTQALSEVRNIPKDSTSIILGATGLGWQRDSGMRIRLEDMLDAVRATDEFRALPTSRQQELLDATAARLREHLKEVSEDNVVGASASVACGRINMHFDIKGLHYSVDAGFASSLAALDLAVRGLRDGEFDLAVTGGVSEMLTPLEMVAFSKMGDSPDREACCPSPSGRMEPCWARAWRCSPSSASRTRSGMGTPSTRWCAAWAARRMAGASRWWRPAAKARRWPCAARSRTRAWSRARCSTWSAMPRAPRWVTPARCGPWPACTRALRPAPSRSVR